MITSLCVLRYKTQSCYLLTLNGTLCFLLRSTNEMLGSGFICRMRKTWRSFEFLLHYLLTFSVSLIVPAHQIRRQCVWMHLKIVMLPVRFKKKKAWLHHLTPYVDYCLWLSATWCAASVQSQCLTSHLHFYSFKFGQKSRAWTSFLSS